MASGQERWFCFKDLSNSEARPASDEPRSVGARLLQALPSLVVQQLQVRHGGRPHLINAPFCTYPAWLAERGDAWDGPLIPHLASGAVRQLARIGEGCQGQL